jgi:hypothetical protein
MHKKERERMKRFFHRGSIVEADICLSVFAFYIIGYCCILNSKKKCIEKNTKQEK